MVFYKRIKLTWEYIRNIGGLRMQEREMKYDTVNNVVYIDAKESEFVPKFLEYLLEYHKIAKDAKRVFLRDPKE